MVCSLEPNHLEGKNLLVVVGGGAEADGQVDVSEGSCALPWHDAMGIDRSRIRPTMAPFHSIVPGKQAIPIG